MVDCERVNWLCSCGTGRLAVPENEVPDYCPLCGYPIFQAGQEDKDERYEYGVCLD
jgi:hypothetical protein